MINKLLVMIIVVIMLGAGIIIGCSPNSGIKKITLQLNWYHAAEFIGYYTAQDKGYYSQNDLDVTINEGGPGIAARDYIFDGRSDFSIASFDEQKDLLAAKKPSVAVMSVFQIPPLVIFSLADSGIRQPEDMIGKRVGVKNDYWRNILLETLQHAGVDPASVLEVKVNADAQQMLYDHQVDLWMGYAHDEPVAAEVAGYSVINIYPADYGVGGYEGLLLVNSDRIPADSGMISRFVKASREGLQYAVEHPDEAAEILHRYQNMYSFEHCRLAVKALIPLVDTPQAKIGFIDAQRWEKLMGTGYNRDLPGFDMSFLN